MTTWNPELIAMIRKTVPNLIARDIVGVCPMTAPSAQIFWFAHIYGHWQRNFYDKYVAVMKLYHLHHARSTDWYGDWY